jgi:hypothetical protein
VQTHFFFLIFIAFFLSTFTLNGKVFAEKKVIACINGSPILYDEYNRLFQKELRAFQKNVLFDPWQAASVQAYEERIKVLEAAKTQTLFVIPNEVEAYKNLFEERQKQLGTPVNTYDLAAYASENALLLQYFRKKMHNEILSKLTDKELLRAEALKKNLRVEPWETESRLKQIKSKYTSETNYRDFLLRNNSTELELVSSLEDQILVEKLKTSLNSNGTDIELLPNDNLNLDGLIQDLRKQSMIKYAAFGESFQSCDFQNLKAPRPLANNETQQKISAPSPIAKFEDDEKRGFFKRNYRKPASNAPKKKWFGR